MKIRNVLKVTSVFVLAGVGFVLWRQLDEILLGAQLASCWKIMSGEMDEEQARKIIKKARDHYRDITARQDSEDKGIPRFLMTHVRLGIGLYRALGEELEESEEDLVKKTQHILWEGWDISQGRAIDSILGCFSDPFPVFKRIVAVANRYMYTTPPWERADVEVEGGIGFDFTACPCYDLCVKEGVPELTRAFCDMDWQLAEYFPPRIEFRREQTLGDGADHCDFRYYRR
jgi:hypothetical protein